MAGRTVPFDVGGATYLLRFSLAVYRQLDPEGKVEVADIYDLLDGPERFPKAFHAMLLDALRGTAGAGPTLEQAEALVDDGGFNAARAAAYDAVRLWLNPKSEVSGDPKAAPGPSPGPGGVASPES